MLAVCMVFPLVPIWAFGEENIDEANPKSVTFKLEKVSETVDSVKVRFVLAEGHVLCFDALLEADEALTCTAFGASQSFKDFANQNQNGAISVNKDMGRISFANTVELSAPMVLAEITYGKSQSKGIELSDISLVIETCYSVDEDMRECESVVTVVNALPEKHIHVDSGEWVETKPASCLSTGESVKYCSECGGVVETKELPKKDHSTVIEKVDATCEEDGYYKETCSVCNAVIKDEVIKATGHRNKINQHKDATCTEDGYDRVICSDCGKLISETVIKSEGHKTEIEEKAATCTEDGYRREICKICNNVVKEEIFKAKGHKIVVDEKAATCEEDGYHKETCSVCKEVLVDTVIPALNHKNTEKQHKDATCTEDGYDRVVCKDCNKVISETVIKAKGHKIVVDEKAATCTEDGYHKEICSVCNKVISSKVIGATGHLHKRTDTLAATCEDDGYIKEYCTDCGMLVKQTTLKAKGHKLVEDVKQATCTEDGYMRYQCSVCKHCTATTVIKAPGYHAWNEWKVVKEPTYRSVGLRRTTCKNCGKAMEEEIPMIVVPVKKIVIVPEEDFKIYCKKTDRLQATVSPDEAAYSADIIWTSSNPKIVEVGEDGTIVAKSRGTATITASTKDGSVTATRNVTVEYSTLQWIIVYVLFGWIWYL